LTCSGYVAMSGFSTIVFATTQLLTNGETWCPSAQAFDFPSDTFFNVSGISDNACCHYYVAQRPASLIDINAEAGMSIEKKNTQIIPANISDLLGQDASVGEVDYLWGSVFAAVNNGTHGALVTTYANDFSHGSASEIVDEPLSWVVADYNTEWAFAGGANAKRIFVFGIKLPTVTLLKVEELDATVEGVAGSALKGYNGLYLVTDAGNMHLMNLTSFAVEPVGNDPFDGPVHGLANMWHNSDGLIHIATASQILHYDTCTPVV